MIAGRFIDRYERRDGVWTIAYRSERNDWSRTTPTNDVYFYMAPNGKGGIARAASRSVDSGYSPNTCMSIIARLLLGTPPRSEAL